LVNEVAFDVVLVGTIAEMLVEDWEGLVLDFEDTFFENWGIWA